MTRSRRTPRILVVDDDPGLLRLLTIRLRAETVVWEADLNGYRFGAAYAGGESSAAAVVGEVESAVDLTRIWLVSARLKTSVMMKSM